MSAPNAIAQQWNLEAPISAMTLNRRGDWVAVALGDGSVALFEANDLVEAPQRLAVHDGVSLSLVADADEHAFLSGGDDGKIFIIEPAVEAPTPLAEQKGKWIDHVAGSVDGFRAYAAGKKVFLLNPEGEETAVFDVPSSVGGMAFSPNGKRLAIAHYNGVSLYWAKAKEGEPVTLMWKGSHLPVIWSPDGKIILSSLQEGALHGWRLSDGNEMQMQGYATKVRSMAFTPRGKYLVTSGADQGIAWPFFGGGPWDKQPLMLGGGDARLVTSVAPHPKDEIVAMGYDDGMVVLAPLDGRLELMLYPPSASKEANVVGLCWNADGDCLFAAQANGALSLYTRRSVERAIRG